MDNVPRYAGDGVEMRPGDYKGRNGLIHCGKCGMPRQCWNPFLEYGLDFIKSPTIPCACKCDWDQIRKQRAGKERKTWG